MTQTELNARDLNLELEWLKRVIETRIQLQFEEKSEVNDVFELLPPKLDPKGSFYASLIEHYEFGFAERLAIILSLAPHVLPQSLDAFFLRNPNYDRGFTEFGGIRGTNHGGFIPTGETLMFLFAGTDLSRRFEIQQLFGGNHVFSVHKILTLEASAEGEPLLSGVLRFSTDLIDQLTLGEVRLPIFSNKFPATLVTTEQEWTDLILDPYTMDQINEIKIWIENESVLMNEWGLGKKIRPGFRCLFHGLPGTGKTLTAGLLGKHTGRPVYKIDLSAVVSKYIGETEKNLSRIFDEAESKDWILFFDEADALFGKRTKVDHAHDRYANQEISYLLQRLEHFDGVAILATNMKANLDRAFARRFESIIHFPVPNASERQKLWQKGFSQKCKLDKDVDLKSLAERYELTGGTTMNVILYSSLKAVNRKSKVIKLSDVEEGIKKEYQKEGRTL